MKLFETLDDDTFLLYAARNYYNPTCIDAEEFYEDINRFKYVKRLIRRYQDTNELPINLILNHLVVILNVFGVESGIKMMEFKLSDVQWSVIKPFLVYLNAVPNDKYVGVEMDPYVVQELRKI